MSAKLIRYSLNDRVTLGHLFLDEEYQCDTLELPWRDNAHRISCIPEGSYTLRYSELHRVGPCYEVLNVPGRDGILIHVANTVLELEGCIAVGIKCLEEVRDSKQTIDRLFPLLGNSLVLDILE